MSFVLSAIGLGLIIYARHKAPMEYHACGCPDDKHDPGCPLGNNVDDE